MGSQKNATSEKRYFRQFFLPTNADYDTQKTPVSDNSKTLISVFLTLYNVIKVLVYLTSGEKTLTYKT
jgi:hypothetical protein